MAISGKFGLISGKGMNKSSIEQGMNKVCATRATFLSWFFISCRGIEFHCRGMTQHLSAACRNLPSEFHVAMFSHT